MLDIRLGKKEYSGRLILNIPAFHLDAGIYWLQGINGSGKTTLLRMLAGLVPFSGDVLHRGISLQQQPLSYRETVSWAEAEPLYPDFIKGRELIAFYQEIRKTGQREVDDLIRIFGMKPHLHTALGAYSSGMVKRLSLLLAFIGHAPLLLLDEPLATLDAEAAGLLPGLIMQYHCDHGSSFLFSSHQSFPATLMVTAKLLVAGQTIQQAV